jgi:hypothetical protein
MYYLLFHSTNGFPSGPILSPEGIWGYPTEGFLKDEKQNSPSISLFYP